LKIIYLVRGELQVYPPCLSQIQYLNEFGLEVLVVCGGCDDSVKTFLRNKGIRCVDMEIKRKGGMIFDKILCVLEYRRKAASVVKQYFNEGDLLWYGTADSAFLLTDKVGKKIKFVLTVLELYDNNRFYKYNIGRIIHSAQAVICCEETRADIMKHWWQLEQKPYVLVNTPYDHPKQLNLAGTIDFTTRMIKKFGDGLGIIYQGIFSKDRTITKLAIALDELDKDITLYLMGDARKGVREEISTIYEKTIFLGFAPAPFHLEVTSHAQIGVAIYDDSSMNNLFCAPNKIYEYAGFGMPIIGSDVPGLRNTIEKYSAGICVDFDDVSAVKKAIIEIVNHYEEYSENAKKMFLSTNNRVTMKLMLERLSIIERDTEL